MKVYDILTESEATNEAPAGMFKQGLRRVGAAAAGAVGMKGTSAKLSGRADTGKEANELEVALQGYLGRTGKEVKDLDAVDLIAFLKSKGYPTDSLANLKGVLNAQQVDQALIKSIQDLKVAQGGNLTPAIKQAKASDDLGNAANVKNQTNKTAKQPARTKSAGAPTAVDSSFASIKTAAAQLTPAQKKQLITALQTPAASKTPKTATKTAVKKPTAKPTTTARKKA